MLTFTEKLKPITFDFWGEGVYTLEWLPSYCKANAIIHTHMHRYEQFKGASHPNLHVFGLREETGAPRENPCREKM